MEIEEEEASSKKNKTQKVETEGELVEVVKTETQKKKVKIKGPVFEMQQYEFSKVPHTSTYMFKSKAELYDKYKNDRETSLDEYLKLYAYVRNISSKDIYLVTVTDHAKNTLKLPVATKNKIVEMRLNLENIPVPNMIHLHKQTWDVIYNNLLKYTLKVSNYSLQRTRLRIN